MSTICAISTAPGTGGIAVIRVSGSEAIRLSERIFHARNAQKQLSHLAGGTLTYGQAFNLQGELIDEVVAALFRAPHSFTGEDTVELSCHGSLFIQQQLLQALIDAGCRLAEPGEFTRRAFLNEKMDLSQAEAVADLIASTSAGQHRLALNQMRGGFSRELTQLRDQLLHITSLMELELDFSDHEDLEFADRSELTTLADHIETKIAQLVNSFSVGNAIKNGTPVAIIGETNAGKSTLLNALLGEEKAIVSDIHGTTRDVIEDTINLSGHLFRFIDTAGIRQTTDTIESLGIARSFKALDKAQIVILMDDLSCPLANFEHFLEQITPHLNHQHVIVAHNKCDLCSEETNRGSLPNSWSQVYISAKEQTGIDQLRERLVKAAQLPDLQAGDIIISNMRHYEALTHALEAIQRVQTGLQTQLSGDFISQDLRECIFHLSDIIGEVTTDQVLGNIFSRFCIGK
ncbi:tRNA uridine-5-carboxymethylaminomethyl(34) synthesis GTPase MnmE [Parabacteroides distasonis]|nr:tRNA uridine-5-carboxymethylaminomethyl(34) synthesis GTPase MnmE [Parabacteroides distasonis]